MPELPRQPTRTVRFDLDQNRIHVYRPQLSYEDTNSRAYQRRSRDRAVATIQEHRKYNEPLRILMQDMSIDCYRNYKTPYNAEDNTADEEWLTFLLVECYLTCDDDTCAVGVERYVISGYQAERNRIRQLVLATLSPESTFPYSKMHMRKAVMIGTALAAAVALELEEDHHPPAAATTAVATGPQWGSYVHTIQSAAPPPTRFGRWLRMIRRGGRSRLGVSV